MSPALLATGCVNVVGLDGIKNTMGAQWPQLRDTVYARLETLFRAKLDPTDFFLRIDDSSYLVAMPSLEPEDVDVVSLRISYDLHSSCLGHCDLGHIQVSSTSLGDGDTLNLELMPFERIIELAEKAGIESFNLPALAGEAPPEAPSADQGAFPVSLSTDSGLSFFVEHHFVPLWSTANAAVTSYLCEPKAIYSGAQRELIPYVLLSPKERARVEISCLQAGIERLAKATEAADRFLLDLAVSYEVLASPQGRMDLLSFYRGLSAEYRQYINLVITGVPAGVAQSRLSSMVNMLKPFSRFVSATVAPQTRAFTAYQGIGLRTIGFDLRQFSFGRTFRREDADLLVRNARYANLGTFLFPVTSEGVLEIARDAGIQFLSGSAVAPACDEPRGMWRLTWSDLTERLQTASA